MRNEPSRPEAGRRVSGVEAFRGAESYAGRALPARQKSDRGPQRAVPFGAWQGWYVVHYGDYVGYAAAAYIDT